jgi:luciferase family oxidoreductase group 1
MASLSLSILDGWQIMEGRSASDALHETTRLAQTADELGFTRFWVAEHHGTKALAHSSPEVLAAHIASHTDRIRIGSGGVMLPHYSAYKVAENFRLLEALHPGRIDIGVGRGPGAGPLAMQALQEGKDANVSRYMQQIVDLVNYLHDSQPAEHPFAGLVAAPSIPTTPEVWLLGSSGGSAKFAAAQGLRYAFSLSQASDGIAEMNTYHSCFCPSPHDEKPRSLIAVLAICAETQEAANELALSNDVFVIRQNRGLELEPLPSVRTARECGHADDLRRVRSSQHRFVGTPEHLKVRLTAQAKRLRTNELMVATPVHEFAARVRSYELLAEAFEIVP